MVNKKGWIRILEATVAVMIVSSVLVMVYSNQPKRADYSEEIANLQKQILMDISSQKNLRLNVLYSDSGNNYSTLVNFVDDKIPSHLNFSIVICALTNHPTPCKLASNLFVEIADKEIFVDEMIISAEVETYNPKKVRLFIWEK
ncbi:MAG: hypothetical protein WC548_04435 [Candidatus Pacearchaeota archaeon]